MTHARLWGVQGMGWEAQCGEDLRHLLHTLQRLPMDPSQAASNVGPLVTLCNTRFAALPSQPSPATRPSTGQEHARRLHRSLTEGDARPQKHAHLVTARAEQQQKAEPDNATAGSYETSQDTVQTPPEVHVGDDAKDRKLLHNGQHAETSDALQQPSGVDSVLPTPYEAPPGTGPQSVIEGMNESWNGTGVAEGQSSACNGAAVSHLQSSQEAAGQEVGIPDDGEVDMVATSSTVLAAPTVLSELTKSTSSPESGGSKTVSLSMQLDDMG